MLRDVFYYGKKPNAHPRERFVTSLEEAKRLSTTEHFWIIDEFSDYRNFDWDFDFEFMPGKDIWAKDHNNIWPSHYQKDSGTWLCSLNLDAYNVYRTDVDPIPRKNERASNWEIVTPIDETLFDFKWHPDPTDPPYIHQFGTQWNKTGGPRYVVKNATHIKYCDDQIAIALPDMKNWVIPENIDVSNFDFSWCPDPADPPYIHQFGTQWNKTGGPRYVVRDATQIKYRIDQIAIALPNMKNWVIPENIDVSNFDFSWHHDETEPKYIYQFGTLMDKNDGPKYEPLDNNGELVYLLRPDFSIHADVPKYFIETNLEDLVKKHHTETFWALNKNIDYSSFDFNWRPEIIESSWESSYVHVFGSTDSEITHTYFVNAKSYLNGNTGFKFIEKTDIDSKSLSSLFKKPNMFFVDRGNTEADQRFNQLKSKFPDIQKTRYLNTWVDTINRCLNKCTTELCWILNSELDYTDFDFEYYPNPWQMKMVHVFGTQWNHWGTTFVVNKESFPNDTKYIKIIEHLPNINFVKQTRAKATNCLHDIYFINHGNDESSEILKELQNISNNVYEIEYKTDYLQTFKNLIEELPIRKNHYVWVCSSIVKYDNFDFTYICDPFSLEQLHVFPSDKQKYGDTFFVNVNKLRTVIDNLNKLDDLEKINFNPIFKTTRLPCPVIVTDSDTHTDFARHNHNFPYAVYLTEDNKTMMVKDEEPISLWSSDSKTIVVTSEGASRVIIPKEAKEYVKKELYDYPYIITSSRVRQSRPMDIVFLSNGESRADENFEHLQRVVRGSPNRLTRVDGVNGRVAAYHAAAEASNTPWMFTVFAKLKVNEKFNWSWQPDRLQIPKHYIFTATNPVNGLEYGHQAMIAYNKKLTLGNIGKGLDFTMDDEHEVVSMNSGIAAFNTDPWSTWRTAFREAIKLANANDQESKGRLHIWLTVANGDFAQYSLDGAKHAMEYHTEVNGDLDKLKLSYDWPWLKAYFDNKYK